jgi:hypothetical protein
MSEIEITSEETRQLFREVYYEMVRDHGDSLTIKDTIWFDKLMQEVRKRLAKSDKEYPTQDFCHYLHGKILESNVSEKDTLKSVLEPALEETLAEFRKDDSYWDKVKSVPMKSKHFRQVVDAYMEHPAQQSLMATTGCGKSDLYSNGSVNKHARNLIKQKKVEDRIRRLESAVEVLSEELTKTKECVEESLDRARRLEDRVEHVETKLNSNIPDDDWVMKLHRQGVPSKDISDITKLHLRKVQRIIKKYTNY